MEEAAGEASGSGQTLLRVTESDPGCEETQDVGEVGDHRESSRGDTGSKGGVGA